MKLNNYRQVGISLLVAAFLASAPVFAQTRVQQNGLDGVNPATVSNPNPVQVDISGAAMSASNPVPVQTSQGGAAISVSNPLFVEATNGTASLNGLAQTAGNTLPVANGNSTLSTYAYSTGYLTPVATPTDIVGIIGSASKTLKIQKIVLNNTQTTAGINQWFLIKRSSANTGSTPVAITACPLDSANATASGTVQKYTTTNPTVGSAVATIASVSVPAPAPASNAAGSYVLFDAKVSGQPIVLRGVAEELDLNFAGAALPTGLSIDADIQMTQE